MEAKLPENSENQVDVLLVEDNPYDAELVLRAFAKQQPGTRVAWFRDGVAALDFIFGQTTDTAKPLVNEPRLVMLDLKLPFVNGREVLKTLKQDMRTACIPIVVLTSSDEETDVVQSFLAEANSYIVKPVDYYEFIRAIQQIGFYWLQLNQPPG